MNDPVVAGSPSPPRAKSKRAARSGRRVAHIDIIPGSSGNPGQRWRVIACLRSVTLNVTTKFLLHIA